MDPWFVIALALLVATLVLAAIASRDRAAIRRIRASLEVAPDVDPAVAATKLGVALEARSRELDDTRATTDRLLDVVGPGVMTVGADLRIRAANAAAHDLLRWTPGTLAGRTVMEAFLDVAAEDVTRSALAVGSAATELRPAGADGPTLVVRGNRTPGGDAWLFLDDITELSRLQRIRAEFIDNLSHELRTPLTTVSLLAETLSREADAAGPGVPDKMRDRIAKIEVETGHLVQMVNELLDLTRIESGPTLQLVDGLDLGRLAADATERLRLFAERQGVDLRIETPAQLPPVRGDPARLGQVVVNLVHNAVKFSPDGGDVAVRVERDGDSVVVAVEDHGVGIPKAAQDRVFERFYKVDRARLRAEAGGGTGLGLAIARHVIEQHGGRIWVESEEGVGSDFRFSVPIVAPEA